MKKLILLTSLLVGSILYAETTSQEEKEFQEFQAFKKSQANQQTQSNQNQPNQDNLNNQNNQNQNNQGYENNQQIIVPNGTGFMIQTNEEIDMNNTGGKFSGNIEGDIVVGNQVAIPSGTKVFGVINNEHQAGRLLGRSEMSIILTQILIDNKLVSISTNELSYESDESSGRDTLGKTARGAAVGALFGGHKGAGTGAAVGLGLSAITKGDSLEVPANSYLNFNFTTSVIIN